MAESFKLTIGGKEYILPPLTLRFMPKVAPQVDRILASDGDRASVSYIAELADAGMEIVTTALAPSFPALDHAALRDQLEQDFTWPDRLDFVTAVFDYLRANHIISPVKATATGEAGAPV